MSEGAHDLIAALRFHKHPLCDQAADRIAELEAALRELLDTFNPAPRMDDVGLIWGRAAKALKGS